MSVVPEKQVEPNGANGDVLLDARLTLRMSVGMSAYARELAERLPRVAPDMRFDVYRRGGNFGVDEQLRLPAYALRTRPRLVHHLSVYAPLLTPRPFAITIHDLIHLRFPEQFKRSVGPYYATVVRAVCARATIVFWMRGSCSSGHSRPRSPRATITPSAAFSESCAFTPTV